MDLVFGTSEFLFYTQLFCLLFLHVIKQTGKLGAKVIEEWLDIDAIKILVCNGAINAHAPL